MFGEPLKPREIHIRLETAETAALDRIQDSEDKVLFVWKEAFLEECDRWMEEKHLSREELVFLLCHVAREIDEDLV